MNGKLWFLNIFTVFPLKLQVSFVQWKAGKMRPVAVWKQLKHKGVRHLSCICPVSGNSHPWAVTGIALVLLSWPYPRIGAHIQAGMATLYVLHSPLDNLLQWLRWRRYFYVCEMCMQSDKNYLHISYDFHLEICCFLLIISYAFHTQPFT